VVCRIRQAVGKVFIAHSDSQEAIAEYVGVGRAAAHLSREVLTARGRAVRPRTESVVG
jgi:hypothetical protein